MLYMNKLQVNFSWKNKIINFNLNNMNIDGIWYNELGSQVNFAVSGNQLTGTYQTAVGDAIGIYQLIGQVNTSIETGQALGFVVVWQNENKDSNSVTTWSGQAQEIDGEDIITTTWLLTAETEIDGDWESTLVGKDVFTRNPQNKRSIKKSAKPFPKVL